MRILKFQLFFVVLLFGFMLAVPVHVRAAEEPQPTEKEYQTQYADAIKLADMLRNSPYLVHNKLYTAEQEAELQALVDSVCESAQSDMSRAGALLTCISERLEPGVCFELNGWDTLCDGDTTTTITGMEGIPKKQADQESYCYTFYDVCRLAGIPCFILEDCKGINEVNNQYICMVYLESPSGDGTEWYFVDVMAEDGRFIRESEAYEVMGDKIFPMNILLDYDKMMNVMNVIFLNKETMLSYSGKSKITPYLAYDRDADTVKTYFQDGTLANEEQYCRTEETVGRDGEPPSGWIETKKYSAGYEITYLQYSLYGVFLRGRVDKDGTEHRLTGGFYGEIPYCEEVEREKESEEHRAYIDGYWKECQDKVIKVAEALLEDENYIWADVYFEEEEDEALVREAVETALDWEYINGDEQSVSSFKNAGISLEEEDPEHLSDKAKAQAILAYIKRNVKSVSGGALYVNSASVLRLGEGICEAISLLYHDMCVMAGIPCFTLICSLDMDIGDSLFGGHANNLVKVGDEWLFLDPMNQWVLGVRTGYQIGIIEEYDTLNKMITYPDCETVRIDNYYKWGGRNTVANYYDFDGEGNLGIYRRNRFGEPVVIDSGLDRTDENGKFLVKNGLYTEDLKRTSEDGRAQVVNRYAYYIQNLRFLKGKKTVDGKEYNFGTDNEVHTGYQKIAELSRRYYIYKLDFTPIEAQPYSKAGVRPIPEIYDGDKKLELGKDFEIVEYANNKELTTYTDARYTVRGIGDYVEDATRTFKIVPADISNVDVELSETSYVWTPGQYNYRPEVSLDMDLGAQDYTVAYYDYNKPGQAKVVVTGKGNYKGSVTKYYDISQRVWNEKEFQILDSNQKPLQSQEFMYNFYPVTAGAGVYWCDEEGRTQSLLKDVDYELTYSDTTKPGVVTVTATAKGNYKGSLTCTYKINKYDIGDNSGIKRLMAMGEGQFENGLHFRYTGSPIMPDMPDFGKLEEGVHYTMTVKDNVNAGTAKIILQGIGVCTGIYEKKFEITPYTLRQNMIQVEYRSTMYNGKVQKPSVQIKADLTEGRDYFISYEKEVDGEYQETEPKEVGKYWVAIHAANDNVRFEQGDSDTDVSDCCYISYCINRNPSLPGGDEDGGNTGGGNIDNGNTDNGNTNNGNTEGDNTSGGNNNNSVMSEGNSGSSNSGGNEAKEKNDNSVVPGGDEDGKIKSLPEVKGKKLTVTGQKCTVKVTSASTKNPQVAYVGTTNKKAAKITVPDTVSVNGVTYKVASIADKAFYKNKKITSVTVGKNVTAIGKSAFRGCTKLKTVLVKSTVLKKIGVNVFNGDKKLKKITLKTTKLTKKSIGKNVLKGTNKKCIIYAPKNKVSAYKRYFKKKGNKNVKVTVK